jgi:hypothetical protein
VLLISGGTLAYLKLFTRARILEQVHAAPSSYWAGVKQNATTYLLLRSMSIFGGHSVGDLAYKGLLVLVLAGSVAMGLRRLVRHNKESAWTLGDLWLIACLILAFTLPFVPPDLNGSHFFAARLLILIWIAALASASEMSFGKSAGLGVAAGTVVMTVLLIGMGVGRIGPVARDIANAPPLPDSAANKTGLLLSAREAVGPSVLNYDPFLWSGVHLLRQSDAVLYNTPWLDLQIIPLGPLEGMPTGKIDSGSLEMPVDLRKTIEGSETIRALVFSKIDFAIINRGLAKGDVHEDSVLANDPRPASHWSCAEKGWYAFCTANVAVAGMD